MQQEDFVQMPGETFYSHRSLTLVRGSFVYPIIDYYRMNKNRIPYKGRRC